MRASRVSLLETQFLSIQGGHLEYILQGAAHVNLVLLLLDAALLIVNLLLFLVQLDSASLVNACMAVLHVANVLLEFGNPAATRLELLPVVVELNLVRRTLASAFMVTGLGAVVDSLL